jgi:hypothetical protein
VNATTTRPCDLGDCRAMHPSLLALPHGGGWRVVSALPRRAEPVPDPFGGGDTLDVPLWLVAVTTALWCFVLNWLWVTFVGD